MQTVYTRHVQIFDIQRLKSAQFSSFKMLLYVQPICEESALCKTLFYECTWMENYIIGVKRWEKEYDLNELVVPVLIGMFEPLFVSYLMSYVYVLFVVLDLYGWTWKGLVSFERLQKHHVSLYVFLSTLKPQCFPLVT